MTPRNVLAGCSAYSALQKKRKCILLVMCSAMLDMLRMLYNPELLSCVSELLVFISRDRTHGRTKGPNPQSASLWHVIIGTRCLAFAGGEASCKR